jgi:hypothetical protein
MSTFFPIHSWLPFLRAHSIVFVLHNKFTLAATPPENAQPGPSDPGCVEELIILLT